MWNSPNDRRYPRDGLGDFMRMPVSVYAFHVIIGISGTSHANCVAIFLGFSGATVAAVGAIAILPTNQADLRLVPRDPGADKARGGPLAARAYRDGRVLQEERLSKMPPLRLMSLQ
jgi:hypothetical protein